MPKLLIIEDNETLALGLREGFSSEGYTVAVANDGQLGMELARKGGADLIILDVMLPGISGFEVCRELRMLGNKTPILFLSVRSEESDKVNGLRLGGDDYLTKPFSFLELVSRVEAVIRRASRRDDTEETFQIGSVTVNLETHEVTKQGTLVPLSPTEFNVLAFLIAHRNEVITRDRLLNAVWGYENYPFSRTVDVHIAKLRKKIEDSPDNPRHLITIHRTGYRLAFVNEVTK